MIEQKIREILRNNCNDEYCLNHEGCPRWLPSTSSRRLDLAVVQILAALQPIKRFAAYSRGRVKMDEKLRKELHKITDGYCSTIRHKVIPDGDKLIRELEQAFREADWLPRSERQKHIDLEKMPVIKAQLHHPMNFIEFSAFNNGVNKQHQACVDWLKQQLKEGR